MKASCFKQILQKLDHGALGQNDTKLYFCIHQMYKCCKIGKKSEYIESDCMASIWSHKCVCILYCFISGQKRALNEKDAFSTFCYNILKDRRCLPFDSTEPTPYSADFPSNLYLDSAELNMFGNLGSFHKVSKSVHNVGVTDDFLLSLGVRKSVSIDFLFENLHTLNYTDDPKPLVDYLRSATLTKADLQKLKSSQYLPAENDRSQMFAPGKFILKSGSIFMLLSPSC